jgi:hypothetical protein
MAQDKELVKRGMLLFGMMLILVTLVGFVLFRPRETAPAVQSGYSELVALATANPLGVFPAQVNWPALAALGKDLRSAPGWEVRYNATLALARLGSSQLPLDVLREMLDEEQQMRNFRIYFVDGKQINDEYAARKTVLNALECFVQWHSHKDAVKAIGEENLKLKQVYAAIDSLAASENQVVREKAEAVQKTRITGH